MNDLKNIYTKFRITGTPHSCEPFGNGHINRTYLLKTKDKETSDYILQKINHKVFSNIQGLMENIRIVTSHLKKKLSVIPGCMAEREVLTLIPSIDDHYYYRDERGDYWRMFLYIWPSRSYDVVPSGHVAFEGGKTFGKFQRLLSDLPGDQLIETIPDFHNIKKRLQAFYTALEMDIRNRKSEVQEEIRFIEQNGNDMPLLQKLGDSGIIPKRVTHNDTKFNNVLLDEQNRGLCIIDLDTVMPGYVHYDFGDIIRTATNRASEDERNLSLVETDLNIFKSFASGFLTETKGFLRKEEIDHLVFSGRLMTFTMGLRFLTDYLNGDIYYSIHRTNQNLDRCRTQFKLFKSLCQHNDEMEEIISELTR